MERSSQLSQYYSASSAIFRIYRLLIIFFSILVLYFAQTIVIPLITAALLTFLLAPLVIKLEKWVGRIFSILLVVIVVFSVVVFLAYIFIKQLILFGSNFKSYFETIQAKFESFQFPEIFNRIGQVIKNFVGELFGNSNFTGSESTSPATLKLLDFSSSFINFIESFFGSFFNIVGMTGMVLLLVIFMLLNKEDIQGRIIKLIGHNRISSTTSAMNEASGRVYRYLFRLFVVNIIYGMSVAAGLYLIGIPNALLWGCFSTLMRFIPYIGAWIAAIIPIALSFVITNTWAAPLLTISFFIIIELITANIVEPFYYGGGTGVSSFALIVAAIFWTWFWGPIGLLLSTPLTVCLVVLGQYATNMSFLSILLSHEQALTPAEECYHRLLAFDTNEPMEFIEPYLQKKTLVSLYDTIILPIVVQAEKDVRLELIDTDQKEDVYQNIREIIEYIGINEQKGQNEVFEKGNILCLPLKGAKDEIGVEILTQLLDFEGFNVRYSSKFNMSEIYEIIDKIQFDATYLCVVAPFVFSKVQFLCAKIHQRKPQLKIIVCCLGLVDISPQLVDKLKSVGASNVVATFNQAIQVLQVQKNTTDSLRSLKED